MTDIKNKFKILGEDCKLATEIPTEGSDALVTSGQVHSTLTSKLQSVLGVPLIDSWDTAYASGIPTISAVENYVSSILSSSDSDSILNPFTRHPSFPSKQTIFQEVIEQFNSNQYDIGDNGTGLTDDFKQPYLGKTFFIKSTTKKQLYGADYDNTSVTNKFIYINDSGEVYEEDPEPWVIYYNNEEGQFCRWDPDTNDFVNL